MIIEVGILNSKIKTEDKNLLSQLVELFSFKTPGYAFTPAYRRRGWDGNTKFISNTGVFRTGLLFQILEQLKKIDLIPEIKYQYDIHGHFNDIVVYNTKLEKYTLFPFQKTAVLRAISNERCIIQSPTGSGKSLIMAAIVKILKDKKGVILFNSIQLVTQFHKFLKSCGIDAGICFGNNFIYHDIMLCTVQSIDKILDTHLEEAEFLMVDEVHEFCKGKVSLEAIRSFPRAQFRYGFTATIPSEDVYRLNLEGALGPVYVTDTTENMIEAGFLVKPVIQVIKVPDDIQDEDHDLSYLEIYEKFIVENVKRNDIIATIVKNIEPSQKGRVLILTESLKHIEILKKLIPHSYSLQGKDDITVRYDTIHKFLNEDETSVLIGSNILQTGVNIEEITHLILARGMKSEIAVIQALGRALRKHNTKERVFVYDFQDCAPYLRIHSKRRIKHYRKEGHEVEII